MKKPPLHILTLLSVMVCLGSLVLSGRSAFRWDVLFVPIGNRMVAVETIDAQLMLAYAPDSLVTEITYHTQNANVRRAELDQVWTKFTGVRWLGIGWTTITGLGGNIRIVVLPLWFIAIATAVLPVRWWLVRRRNNGPGFPISVVKTDLDRTRL